MTPSALLATLRRDGFTLRAVGGRLLVAPASRLTPEQRAAVQTHRDALLCVHEAIALQAGQGFDPEPGTWRLQAEALDATDAAWLADDLPGLRAAVDAMKRLYTDVRESTA